MLPKDCASAPFGQDKPRTSPRVGRPAGSTFTRRAQQAALEQHWQDYLNSLSATPPAQPLWVSCASVHAAWLGGADLRTALHALWLAGISLTLCQQHPQRIAKRCAELAGKSLPGTPEMLLTALAREAINRQDFGLPAFFALCVHFEIPWESLTNQPLDS